MTFFKFCNSQTSSSWASKLGNWHKPMVYAHTEPNMVFANKGQTCFDVPCMFTSCRIEKCHSFWFRSLRNKEPFACKAWINSPPLHPICQSWKCILTCGYSCEIKSHPCVKHVAMILFLNIDLKGKGWGVETQHFWNGSLFRNDRNQKLGHFYNSAARKHHLLGHPS